MSSPRKPKTSSTVQVTESLSTNPVSSSAAASPNLDTKEDKPLQKLIAMFSYQEIQDGKLRSNPDNEFCSFSMDKNFITFGYVKGGRGQKRVDVGWKIHVSIDDSDMSNLAKGWNVILPILIEHKINCTKVANKQCTDEDNFGKQITIYQFKDPDKEWQAILTEITQALKDNDVKSGRRPLLTSSKLIPGSNYLSYRHDGDSKGKYIRSDKAKSYNENGLIDPNDKIEINVPGQQQPKGEGLDTTVSLVLNKMKI